MPLPPQHWPECQTCGKPVDTDNCVEVSATRFLNGVPAPLGTLLHHIDCFMQEDSDREQAQEDREADSEGSEDEGSPSQGG